jgi:hypothetical protein
MIYSIAVILVLWSLGVQAATLPPDPDNAALLYYQAFLLRPEPDFDTSQSINEVLGSGDANEKVRKYLNLSDVRDTIEITEAAAQLLKCDWGIQYSRGFWGSLPQLEHLRPLSYLLYADARVLAADEGYRAAFDRCLTMRRFAGHVGDDLLISYMLSLEIDRLAHRCTQDVLASMPPDTDILTWLRGQLVVVRDVMPSFIRALEMDFELGIESLRINPEHVESLKKHLAEKAEDENTRNRILSLTDEELIVLFRELYEEFFNSIFHVMDNEMTYEQKYLEIQRLTRKMEDKCSANYYVNTGQIAHHYNLRIRNETQFNALKAAIAIYLIKAETGKLPKTLPEGLPKDPYSNQDFGYEITEEGFTFHSQGEDFQGHAGRLLDFKVQQ